MYLVGPNAIKNSNTASLARQSLSVFVPALQCGDVQLESRISQYAFIVFRTGLAVPGRTYEPP